MLYRGIAICLTLAAVGLAACPCRAQDANQPPAAPGPNLVPVKTETSTPAGTTTTAPTTPAQTPTTGPAATGQKKDNSGGLGGMWFYVVLLGGFVLLYVWMGRSRRKQESKRKEMLSTLKKGDKIVTIGGIIGTIIEARPDEITIKVDETNNVRMKFARWSVRGVGDEARQNPDQKK